MKDIYFEIKKIRNGFGAHLNLSNSALNEIPPEVFDLTHLTTLNLGNEIDSYAKRNSITKIPNEIEKLKNLQRLIISHNKIKYISPKISSLSNLEELYIANNNITEFPKSLCELKKLKYLSFQQNEFSFIPSDIIKLSELLYFDFSNNKVNELPVKLFLLQNIISINASNNKIQKIPQDIIHAKSLSSFNIVGNPITNPPPEICNASNNIASIQNYFHELAGEGDLLYEIKLILIGEERAGKSSLAEALSDPKYVFKDKKSTEGIDIINWVIPKKELNLDKDFKVNIWDFGGQEIYHATHQLFFTNRSLYFLVTEARKDLRQDDFFYWLNLIESLSDKSPTIIILTKCDQPYTDLAINEFKEYFENIVGYNKVSCKSNYSKTLTKLKVKTQKIILNSYHFPDIGIPLPGIWIEIRNEIEKIKNEGVNHITYNDYLNIASDFGMGTERAKYLSEFFHRLGVFLHFDSNIYLLNIVFLNFEWVTNAVYKILDDQIITNNKGSFSIKDITRLWSLPSYSDQKGELIELMINFELCYKVDKSNFIAPQLLPSDKPQTLEAFLDEKKTYNYELHFKFLPKGVLPKLIVKLHEYIYGDILWKYGVVLKVNNSFVLIQEKYLTSPKKIIIKFLNEVNSHFLFKVLESIEKIINEFKKLEITKHITCYCKDCNLLETPMLFNIDHLYKRLERNKFTIECDMSLDNINILDLFDTYGLRKSSRNNINLIRNSIFVSYSHNDKKWLERLKVHIKALENEGTNVRFWSDEKIKSGMNWKNEIELSLKSAKIAILLITADFFASDFIQKEEIPTILKSAKEDGLIILPVIINYCRYEKNPFLSSVQAFNSPSKPLATLEPYEIENIYNKLIYRIEELL